jgi:SpoVK/Ycf46/Vps4 family AAA+-type ATPase
MAAEVIARELRTSLYRVSLNNVVSKYIGETEKNLSRIFEDAQKKGWILFFDEADALFGKRSEVKDSHDRYANVEVSYLLAQIEAYRGLVILTSHSTMNVDPRVMCRVKYLLEFSPPIPSHRIQPRR